MECANISIFIHPSYGCSVSVHVAAMFRAGLQMQSRKRLSRDSCAADVGLVHDITDTPRPTDKMTAAMAMFCR